MGSYTLSGKPSTGTYSVIIWLLLLGSWISYMPSVKADLLQESAKEYQIKAVYLFNFSFFVSWQKNIFSSADEAFTYCIVGENPFGRQLDLTVQGEKVEGREIKTRYLKDFKKATNCQIVFIAQSERQRLNSILDFLNKRPVLTISDIPEFIDKGGMIRFYTNRRRQVRIAIEPDTLKESGLGVSGNLLRVSEIVRR